MKMFNLFTRKSPNKVFFAILLGILAGLCYSLIIPLVMKVVSPDVSGLATVQSEKLMFWKWEVSDYQFAFFFVCLCLFILVSKSVSQVLLTQVSVAVTMDLRLDVYQRIFASSIATLEKLGPAKMMAILTTDVPRVSMGARMLPDLLTNLVTLVGMLGFLIYLNVEVFWFVMASIVFGIVTYQVPVFIARNYLIKSRKNLDGLHESIRGLLYGIKDLKLNRNKHTEYFEQELFTREQQIRRNDVTGQAILKTTVNYGDLISFFVIGIVSFIVINHSTMTRHELVGVIMALLYVTGPVAMLLNFLPQLSMARISLKRLNDLYKDLPAEAVDQDVHEVAPWESIKFNNVKYRYKSQHQDEQQEQGFEVGPVSFEIKKSEITFIVGGNGSGKSTLSKLISLHYRHDSGDICFGEQVLNDQSITSLRQQVSVIYSDYYLFTRLFGIDKSQLGEQLAEKVNHYLAAFDLEDKVSFSEDRFSTLDLSDGQRRRLALLVSFIENKELYIFDEWAADQDPRFKNIFYREILPALKAKGKAIVVVSHDDRYFDIADQVIQMESGKQVQQPATLDRIDEQSDAKKVTQLMTC